MIQSESTKTNARVNAGVTAHPYIHDASLADVHDANLTTENQKFLQVDVERYKRKQEYKPGTVRNGDRSFEPYKHCFSKERIEREGWKVMRTSQQSELEE